LRVDSTTLPIKVLDTLALYQTSLDRQISKVTGELWVLKSPKQRTSVALHDIASPKLVTVPPEQVV
jgi:hypothetical protein